ncbi:PREDICTED: uncharacterized protein LOC108613203 isoform X2 [Drosophila arizonae]|uniref:Uncharacterized protein LOC108613203 isoform X2 n=1 Tax=Drosophila arizonae TaxID=7263 RepID=A0ABM1P457_DROAR|nr:PREDICTED: uncharacterized protein LOC108613203 isoform X2 [Drosophila arizonae]XP_017861994.1 PREDICTED: uncharacterized protein LOC108613203 isoform X2 [Drosophila arizonae]
MNSAHFMCSCRGWREFAYFCCSSICAGFAVAWAIYCWRYSVIRYTDVYVVVRSFYTDNLWNYEIVYHCCGIDGPANYGNVSQKDVVPASCYRNQVETPANLYHRGCLFATEDSWFWFVFANCYWFAFVLFFVNLITHWKLRKCLRNY